MKIYTIERKCYDSMTIDRFTERKEWEDALDSYAASQGRGRGESFTVAIYEAKNDEIKNWTGVVWHPASRDRHASIDSIPKDWELIDSQEVSFWQGAHIWAEKDKNGFLGYSGDYDDGMPEPDEGGEIVEAWQTDDEIYLSEDEMNDGEAPSNYLYI
jgi:hypothetical protein